MQGILSLFVTDEAGSALWEVATSLQRCWGGMCRLVNEQFALKNNLFLDG